MLVAAITLVGAAIAAVLLLGEWRKEQADWVPIYGPGFPDTVVALARDWSAQTHVWDLPKEQRETVTVGSSPQVSLRDRELHLHPPGGGWLDLTYASCPIGAVRIEWTYANLGGDGDLNSYIGGKDRVSGYTFHVGGWRNASFVALTRGDQEEFLDSSYLPEPVQRGRSYRMVLEKDGGALRLRIDGRVVIDFFDPSEMFGSGSNTFGFDCVGDAERVVSDVLIYHRPLPQRVSPLLGGETLMQVGRFADAETFYSDLQRSYPGTDIGRAALFREAVCAARLGADDRALALLDRFTRDHPGDSLSPYALYERLQLARSRHDQDAAQDLRTRFGTYRGHRLLRMVLNEIAQDRMSDLAPLPIHAVGDPRYADGTPAMILRSYGALKGWGEVYGVPWWTNMYCFTSWRVLSSYGRFGDIVASYPAESSPANEARLRLGRFDDVARLATDPRQRLRAQFLAGRLKPDRTEQPWLYWRALFEEKGPAAVADERACIDEVRADALLLLGRNEEILATFPSERQYASAALTGLKRFDEVPLYRYAPGMANALLAQDRIAELVAQYPGEHQALYRAVLRLLGRGDRQAAHELLSQLDHADVPVDDEGLVFARHVFPVLLRIDDGEQLDPHAAFAAAIAKVRELYDQRLWQLAAYVAGDLDDAGFRHQPEQHLIEERLAWAGALRADCSGHREEALAAYRSFAARPNGLACLPAFERDYLAWRVTLLASLTQPMGPPAP